MAAHKRSHIGSDGPHSRAAALVMLACFVALLATPGGFQLARGTRRSDLARWSAWLANEPTSAVALQKIESDVNARFLLARTLKVWVDQSAPGLPTVVNVGGAIGGVGDWLFLTADVRVAGGVGLMNARLDAATRARVALADLNAQLARRGIYLLVVPIPAKASIYPDKLAANYDLSRGPDLNVEHAAWFGALRGDGVDAIDLTSLFWAERTHEHDDDPAAATSVATDSHWTYHGTELAAAAIASHLGPRLSTLPPLVGATQQRLTRARPTDLRPFAFPDLDARAAEAPITETRAYLLDRAGRVDRCADRLAPILVLGDSYAALHADEGSGFPQALAAATNVAVRSLAIVGGNAITMREPLAAPASLDHVRIVVLAFAIRHLIADDWRPMQVGAEASSSRQDR